MSSHPCHFDYTPGQRLLLRQGHTTLWSYVFNTDRGKPYIHPLSTPAGIALTCFEPWDHQWHRGMWFAWQYINDVNYWEERQGVPPGVGEGRTVFAGPELVTLAPDHALVVTRYAYVPPQGKAVLEERRELTFGTPRDGAYTIDWKQSFTAKTDVTVRRTPEEWGGYTGLGIRTSRGMGGFQRINSEGQRDDETQHAKAAWCDLSGKADGGWDRIGGVTIMVHPDTPRTPAPWKSFGMDGFGYINPSPVMDAQLEMKEGEELTLRYRVLVHDGIWEKAALDDAYAGYRGQGSERIQPGPL